MQKIFMIVTHKHKNDSAPTDMNSALKSTQ